MEQFSQAIADFTMVIELDPAFSLAYYYRGRVHLTLEQFEFAVADLSTAVELRPQLPLASYYRGRSHEGLGQTDEAIVDYRAVVTISNDETLKELARVRLQALGAGP